MAADTQDSQAFFSCKVWDGFQFTGLEGQVVEVVQCQVVSVEECVVDEGLMEVMMQTSVFRSLRRSRCSSCCGDRVLYWCRVQL